MNKYSQTIITYCETNKVKVYVTTFMYIYLILFMIVFEKDFPPKIWEPIFRRRQGVKSIEVDRSVYRARPVYERTPT